MPSNEIRNILSNSDIHLDNEGKILKYEGDVLTKIDKILEQHGMKGEQKWKVIKETIIKSILLENNLEEFFNHIIITDNEIIIHIPGESGTDIEKRFNGLKEIDFFYGVINDILKDNLENISKKVVENIYNTIPIVDPNIYIFKNLKSLISTFFQKELKEEADLKNKDPSIIKGLTGYLIRKNHFNDILEKLAIKILDSLLTEKHPKAERIISFYFPKVDKKINPLIINGTVLEKIEPLKTILRTRKNSSLARINEKTALIKGFKKTIKTISELESEENIVSKPEDNIPYLQDSINELDEIMNNLVLESKKFENILYLYIQIDETDNEIKKTNNKDLNTKLDELTGQFNKLKDNLSREEKEKYNNFIDEYSELYKLKKKQEEKIRAQEKEIEHLNGLIEDEETKLSNFKNTNNEEKKYNQIVENLAKLLIKPFPDAKK